MKVRYFILIGLILLTVGIILFRPEESITIIDLPPVQLPAPNG